MTSEMKMLVVIMTAATEADQCRFSGQMMRRYLSTAIHATVRLDE